MRGRQAGRYAGKGKRHREEEKGWHSRMICNGIDRSRITHALNGSTGPGLANNSSDTRSFATRSRRHVSLTNRKICEPCRVLISARWFGSSVTINPRSIRFHWHLQQAAARHLSRRFPVPPNEIPGHVSHESRQKLDSVSEYFDDVS